MAKNRFGFEQVDTTNKEWQLTKGSDIGIIDRYSAEALAIAGADLNVFKLLGVHEQGKLIDLTGNGIPISGGTANGSSPENAFFDDDCKKFWRSKQKGPEAILNEAYIGYNFGTPKLDNGRDRYGFDADVKEHITTLRIQQSANEERRATRVRVERSDDGETWFGVAIVELENSAEKIQYSFRQTAPTRYWRLRPIEFTGGEDDFWEVTTLELIDWDQTNLFSTQDEYGWIENRDRDYAESSKTIKGYYDLYEKETDLSQFGFTSTGSQFYITCNFNDVVNRLGRPIVIGDIFEVPSEAQFDPNMSKVLKYLEVTDVSWSAEGYAPGWQPTLLRVIAEPMLAKQETMDIVGDFGGAVDQSGLFDLDDSKYSHLATHASEIGREMAEVEVPQRGSDTSEITSFDDETILKYAEQGIDINKISQNQKALYAEDGLPKNGEPYTEGNSYPENPKDGDYHRMTYAGLAESIPPRLYKYSESKGRWVFMEADLRHKYDGTKPQVQRVKESQSAISVKDIGK